MRRNGFIALCILNFCSQWTCVLAYVFQFAAPLWKDQLIQMHRRIGGPQGWSEHSGETNMLPVLRIWAWLLSQSVCIPFTILTELSGSQSGERATRGFEFQSFNPQAHVAWNFYSIFKFMRRFVLTQLSGVLFKNNDAFIVKDTDQCFIQVTVVVLK